MPGPRRSPAWYPDPEDPAVLRYWSGRSWSNRRRVRPPWTLVTRELELETKPPVIEGPAHVDALAANVSPPAVTRPRAARLQATPPSWDTAWDDPRAAALGRPPRSSSGRGAWVRPRRPFVVVGAMLAVALLVVASATGLPERAPDSQVTAAFTAQANELCQVAFAPTARPGRLGGGSNQDREAIATVQPLAARLGGLAARIDNKPDVNAWIATWRQWVASEQADLASRQPRTSAGDLALARQADLQAEEADQFALENGLRSCLLSPQAAASSIAIGQ